MSSGAVKLQEALDAFRTEVTAANAKMLEFMEEQRKFQVATTAELAKVNEALHEASVKAAARSSKTAGPKKKEEMVVPDKQPDIKSWFINYYLNNMDSVNSMLPEEAMSKVMNTVNKNPVSKNGGTQLNKLKATTIFTLIYPANAEFNKSVTQLFEDAHPKTETQAP